MDADASVPHLRPMREADLDEIMRIELRAYPFPWTRGIFRDCMQAGYPMWLQERDGAIVGYGVLSIGVEEAHLLNLCTAPGCEGQGLGRRMLEALLRVARGFGSQRVFLEVRPSNAAALSLYGRAGFVRIGVRRNYYHSDVGREDALVLARALGD